MTFVSSGASDGNFALTMRSRRFFGRRYEMRGGSVKTCFSLSLV